MCDIHLEKKDINPWATPKCKWSSLKSRKFASTAKQSLAIDYGVDISLESLKAEKAKVLGQKNSAHSDSDAGESWLAPILNFFTLGLVRFFSGQVSLFHSRG